MNLKVKVMTGLLSLCACTMFSCSSDSETNNDVTGIIQLYSNEANLTGTDATQTLKLRATGDLTVELTDDWVKVNVTHLSGTEYSVEITADDNNTGKTRTSTVYLVSGKTRKAITVRQSAGANTPTEIVAPEGYQLVWNDEFDKGTELNAASWTHEVQKPGWVNNELQEYINHEIDGNKVTEISDGTLKIHCFKYNGKVYSGRVYAKVNSGWKYGIFEARIKLPKGRGTWPAFWMMPCNNNFQTNPWPRCGEMDIMEEVGYHPNYTSSSFHTESYNHVKKTQKTAEQYTKDAEGDFHVYRLEWTKDYVKTSVDGKELLKFDNDGKGNVATWPFNKNFYIILNLAWGGSWGGNKGVKEDALPVTMEVDYVRVFQQK